MFSKLSRSDYSAELGIKDRADCGGKTSVYCFKVSHSYRIWDVFAQPEVASEVRRTSHFVTSDVVSYPLRYFTIHIPRLSEQVT